MRYPLFFLNYGPGNGPCAFPMVSRRRVLNCGLYAQHEQNKMALSIAGRRRGTSSSSDNSKQKYYGKNQPTKMPYLVGQIELELELIQTQMTQKPILRAEVGMRVRCANKASAECIMMGRGIGQNPRKIVKSEAFVGSAHSAETIKRKARERSS